jgi:iron complex outermembrane receptor protein
LNEMRPLSRIFTLLALGWLGAAQMLPAQRLDSLWMADTVAISTGRIPIPGGATGRHISVLRAEDILRLPVQTSDELLRYMAGLESQTRGAFGAQADLILRGGTFAQTLVLIDGMRINDPLTGHFSSNIPIALSEIERIEVLRGPAASIYGPDAVGGVVHIISKTFAGRKRAVPPQGSAGSSDLGLLYGQERLRSAQGGFYRSLGRLRVGAGFQALATDGQALPPDSTDIRSDISLLNLSASLAWDISPRWSLMGRTAFDSRLFNAQFFYTRSPADLSREQVSQFWTQGRLRRAGEKGISELDFAYKILRDSFLFNPAFPANMHTTQMLNLLAQHSWQVGSRLDFNAGIQLGQRSIVSTDRGDHREQSAGAWLTAHGRPFAGFHATASLRGDYDEGYQFELSPQASLSYARGAWLLRAAAGRGIRAADFTERYVSYNLPRVSSGRNLGNPALLAERSWSYEAGAEFRPAQGWKLAATAFSRTGRNLIDYVFTPASEIPRQVNLDSSGSYFFAQNISRLTTRGIETEAEFRRGLGGGWQLSLQAGYAFYANAGADSLVSKYLSNRARHLLTGWAVLQGNRISLSVSGLYKVREADQAPAIEAELSPAYGMVQVRAEWRLWRQLRVFAQVNNAGNTRAQDILGAPLPARWILGGLRWVAGRD